MRYDEDMYLEDLEDEDEFFDAEEGLEQDGLVSHEGFYEAAQELPEVSWKNDLREIDDDELRDIHIEKAEDILEKDQQISDEYDAGEISDTEWEIRQYEIQKESAKAATRAGLASVGLTPDHLADISEDNDLLQAGNIDAIELKDRLRERIDEIGPEEAQMLADEMLEDGRIGKDAHDAISRQVRIKKQK